MGPILPAHLARREKIETEPMRAGSFFGHVLLNPGSETLIDSIFKISGGQPRTSDFCLPLTP